jgi:hypothetical protein
MTLSRKAAQSAAGISSAAANLRCGRVAVDGAGVGRAGKTFGGSAAVATTVAGRETSAVAFIAGEVVGLIFAPAAGSGVTFTRGPLPAGMARAARASRLALPALEDGSG